MILMSDHYSEKILELQEALQQLQLLRQMGGTERIIAAQENGIDKFISIAGSGISADKTLMEHTRRNMHATNNVAYFSQSSVFF